MNAAITLAILMYVLGLVLGFVSAIDFGRAEWERDAVESKVGFYALDSLTNQREFHWKECAK